jgi:hypothetical protein
LFDRNSGFIHWCRCTLLLLYTKELHCQELTPLHGSRRMTDVYDAAIQNPPVANVVSRLTVLRHPVEKRFQKQSGETLF